MNFQMFKLVLEQAEEPEIQVVNICWIIKKAREFQKNFYFCFTDYTKEVIVPTNFKLCAVNISVNF